MNGAFAMTTDELSKLMTDRFNRVEDMIRDDRKAIWGKLDAHSQEFKIHAEKIGQHATKIEGVNVRIGIWATIATLVGSILGALGVKAFGPHN